jgi:hypothetical protein
MIANRVEVEVDQIVSMFQREAVLDTRLQITRRYLKCKLQTKVKWWRVIWESFKLVIVRYDGLHGCGRVWLTCKLPHHHFL